MRQNDRIGGRRQWDCSPVSPQGAGGEPVGQAPSWTGTKDYLGWSVFLRRRECHPLRGFVGFGVRGSWGFVRSSLHPRLMTGAPPALERKASGKRHQPLRRLRAVTWECHLLRGFVGFGVRISWGFARASLHPRLMTGAPPVLKNLVSQGGISGVSLVPRFTPGQ